MKNNVIITEAQKIDDNGVNKALGQYLTEYYNWIASFSKVNEVFYKHETNSIGSLATVTASSENSSDSRWDDQIAPGSKSIRLDIYVEDDKNTVFNLEMQTTNCEELPKRSRYY
ncbi:MAG: hypothetical protein EGQ18_04425 [Eubacterium ventriosum]|nr:hypothetical protein [Eubacterium ventriosum]